VDVLVNNAGTILVGPVENQRIENFEEAMRINFWPSVYTSFAVTPGMKRRRCGRIVNIGSIGGKIAVPHLLPYSASKFALAGFSQGLRAELAKDGISVTTVNPGLMRTGSPRNVEVTGQHGKEYSWFILADSLPGISIDARRAARGIVQACISGTGEVVLGFTAKCAAMLNAIAPNAVGALLAAANQQLLPAPGNGLSRKKGFENENALTRSALTSLTRRAEVDNNEL
jgi:short-subunit dehydrogenase